MIEKFTAFIKTPFVYKTAILFYVLNLMALAAFSFSINTRDIRSAVYIRGNPVLYPGQPFSTRGLFHYAPTGEILRPQSMSWTLVDDQNHPTDLPFAQGDLRDNWPDTTLHVPSELSPGTYQLRLHVDHETYPPLKATTTVEVRHAPDHHALQRYPWPSHAPPRDENAHRRSTPIPSQQSNGLRLELLPADGEILRGLPDQIFLRLTDLDTGLPVQTPLKISLVSGLLESALPSSLHTNSLGLVKLLLNAATDLTLQIELPTPDNERTDTPTSFQLRLFSVPAQFRFQPQTTAISTDHIRGQAHSVLRDFTYMVDLYSDDHLLDTLSLAIPDGAGAGPVIFELPDHPPLLLRTQVYQSIYGTTHGWDSRYLLTTPGTSQKDLLDTSRSLYTWLADHSESPYAQSLLDHQLLHDQLSRATILLAIDAGLSEIPRHFQLPDVLFNTRQTDRDALDKWRAETKSTLNLLMALLLLGGVAVFFFFVLLGIRRHRREAQLLRDIDLETDLQTSDDQARAIHLERLTIIAQGTIIIITILAFALGILLVVSYL